MNLYAHQQALLNKNPKRYLIAHDRGTGKTISVLELCKLNNVQALIIVPKSIKKQWITQCEHEDYAYLKHKVVTKEEFRKDWEKIGPYNAIVVDEAHWFASLTSKMSKSLQKYLKKYFYTYVWLLTGTPYLSNVWNIFTLAKHLGHKWNYWSFRQKFFYDVRMGARMVPMQKKGIEEEIASLLHTIGETLTLEECVDVPPQTYETEYLELTKDQISAIKNIQEPLHIVRWTKTHQLMGGTLKGDGYTPDLLVDSNKADRLLQIVEENPKSIIVCRYNNEIKYLATILKQVAPVYIINGEVDNREDIVKALQSSDNYCLLVNASCSEGWELGDCPLMVFYSYSFSLKDKLQMEARIRRINKLKKNLYISLVIKDSIDEDVFECLKEKKDFHIALYAK